MSAQPSPDFNADRAERLKQFGIALAEANRLEGVELAREIGYQIARRYGTVTADDVRAVFLSIGEDWLGNAAGSVFRDPRFEFAGFTKSRVVQGHGNTIRRWRIRREGE